MTACFALLMMGMLSVSTAWAENRVTEMEIEVALREDGSAYVTQTWSADTDEGTEFYLGLRDNGDLTVTDFSVLDLNGSFTFVEDWDVDASFEEKANQCGIVETDEGVELCWGITQYGTNRYAIQYVLHDLVGSYSDADGFNHRFVDEMNFFPTDVVLTILKQDGSPLTDGECDIWAFGYDGQIVFEDGKIRAWTESPLDDGDHMTIMVGLKKGILSPMRCVDGSFETVKERAFDGSDYEDGDSFRDFLIGLILFVVCFLGFIVYAFIYSAIYEAKINKRMKQVNYFRDAPNNGNLNVTYRLGRCSSLCGENALLGAYLLRLISEGCLEPTSQQKAEKKVELRLVHPPRSGNTYDDVLYTVLEAAAGTDGVLQTKELEQYCKKNYTPLAAFMDSCTKDGKQTLCNYGCVKNIECESVKDLTEEGNRQLDELLGLKRFLLDFSLIQERGVKEAVIWQDYMVYAMMLGIADKVASQIRELYPDQLPEVERYEYYIGYTHRYNTLMYNAYYRERQRREEARSGGSGGRASRRGGRGFSGGGRGGSR